MAKTKIKSWIDKAIEYVKENPFEVAIVFLILLVGAVLRLYRIDEYMTFLGDEGRDVIVVRRFLVDFDLILVGPGTSIGNMYLGPLYYYMMAPALWLANYLPVGPAIQIAILGVITIGFVYYIGKEWFCKAAGYAASFLFAISPTVIKHSRSSWNPNIMPFFALLTIYSVWQFWKKHKWGWLIVAGISYAWVLQSHYLGLLLLPVIGLFWLLTQVSIWKDRKERRKSLIYSFIGLFIFLVLMSPLVIFDARHGWRNFGAMHEFFAKRQTTISARPWTAIPELPELVEEASTSLTAAKDKEVGRRTAIGLIGGLVVLLITGYRRLKERELSAYFLLLVWLGVAFIGFGVYKQEIYDHYYGVIFAAPFLLMGGLIGDIKNWAVEKGGPLKLAILGVLVFVVAALAVTNFKANPLKEDPNRQLQRTKDVAARMVEEAGDEKFNIAVIAERNYEGAYQYFLEKWNAPFVIIDPQRADETITEQLFVVCEYEDSQKCQPTSNPKAEIANFGWSKIDETWEVSGVILYKLVHNRP